MDNYILTYYQQIQDGTVKVSKWVKLIYEYIIKGLENKTFFYNHKKAQACILFIERFCHHHEGDLAPNLIKLELWQKAMLSVVFGVLDEKGNRQFREVFMVVARKNGKTLLASAIAEYCTFMDGEYGGRIYFSAPKLEQAHLGYDAYYQMILQEPEISRMAQKRRTDIYVAETNTSAKPLSFNAKKSDGLNISFCVADEVASWQGDQGLKFYEVIKSSFGSRRQGLLLNISSSGYINDGIYDELMKRATRFLLGDSKERRLLPILYMIDDPEKWDDINELQKSNPNLGVSVSVDYLLDEIAVAQVSLSKKAEFLTKYCNVKQNSSLAWLESQVVQKAYRDLKIEDVENTYAVAGIDLSRTTDLSCACILIEKDGIINVLSQFFMPRGKIEELQATDGVPYEHFVTRGLLTLSGDNFIDYHDVYDWIVGMAEEHRLYILKIGYDRYNAQYLTQDLAQYGFHMDSVFQGDNLWGTIQITEGLLKDGKINIGDNDLLKSHLLNSAIKMSHERGRGRLVKLYPTAHVDGTAALLDAMVMREKWCGEIGEQLKNED